MTDGMAAVFVVLSEDDWEKDAMTGQFSTQDRKAMLGEMAQEVYDVNLRNGWFDKDRTVGDGIALLHSEASEAFDAFRKYGYDDVVVEDIIQGEELQKPISYGSELADVLIRLLDQCLRDGVDIVREFDRKMKYNAKRGYRHGGRQV